MKAVRLIGAGQPLELQHVPIPPIGDDDVLVRVKAAGICHSDAHYRAGVSPVEPLPLTLGHEVAGIIDIAGRSVRGFSPGDRVCLHYMATCGSCSYCYRGSEQFCVTGEMLGKHRDGGFAEYVAVPASSVFRLPDDISLAHGAVMMCSSATSLHALRKARVSAGESVAVFGIGGLGLSAVQLAAALDAGEVFAVDINPRKLALAEGFGAIPIDASAGDPVEQIHALTNGQGVDVALELIGLPLTMQQALRSLDRFGRAALAGLTDGSMTVSPYAELLCKEAELIGVSDHLASEIPALLDFARGGALDLSEIVTRTIPLDAAAINATLDDLDAFGDSGRIVVEPV